MISTFQITSILGLEPFETEQQVWILAEKSTMLIVERKDNTITKKREFEIPNKLFENDTFHIGNSCMVGKFFLSATKDSSDNLEIKITSPFNNEEHSKLLEFDKYDHLVELLKDNAVLGEIKLKYDSIEKLSHNKELNELEKREEIEKVKRVIKREISDRLFNFSSFSSDEQTKYLNRIYVGLEKMFHLQDKLNITEFENLIDTDNEYGLNYIEKNVANAYSFVNILPEDKVGDKGDFKFE